MSSSPSTPESSRLNQFSNDITARLYPVCSTTYHRVRIRTPLTFPRSISTNIYRIPNQLLHVTDSIRYLPESQKNLTFCNSFLAHNIYWRREIESTTPVLWVLPPSVFWINYSTTYLLLFVPPLSFALTNFENLPVSTKLPYSGSHQLPTNTNTNN